MKNKMIWSVFVIALLSFFIFQASWLYHVYKLNLLNMEQTVNDLLIESAKKDLDDRFAYMESLGPKSVPDTFVFENSESRSVVSQQFEFMQIVLSQTDVPFDLSSLDSIYCSILKNAHIDVRYKLIYQNSTHIIQTKGINIERGYKTQRIPIVNGAHVQAVVEIPLPVIFKQMLWMLIISILMSIFIIGCLIYELHIIFTQFHLSRLREDFSHALTHDMKTPLGTIYMALDQWKKGMLDTNPEMRTKFSEIAIQQVLNLQVLVDKILTIAKLEQNKLTLDKQYIDMPRMVRELVDKFTIQGGKKVDFKTFFDLKDHIICADPTYLKNAISNLIDNAVKYSDDSLCIEIYGIANEKQLLIKVKDNGFGISIRDQQKIFEKFERGSAVKRNDVRGFGLGLNYVKRVVEAHGGTVAISSMEGHGSEFVVVVPLINLQAL